jgi:hypothetical protein
MKSAFLQGYQDGPVQVTEVMCGEFASGFDKILMRSN